MAGRRHVRGVRVPGGKPVDCWIGDDRLPGDREAPGRWVVPGGPVDAHAHLTFEPHAVAAASSAAHAFLGVEAGPDRVVTFATDPVAEPAALARPATVIAR